MTPIADVKDRVRFKVGWPGSQPTFSHWLYGTVLVVINHRSHFSYQIRLWNEDGYNQYTGQYNEDSQDVVEKLSEDEYQSALLLIS